jgi:flagellar basal body-associated protein FliL
MLGKRNRIIVLSLVVLIVAVAAAYAVFFARPGHVEGRPTLVYFRLET